jgi:hypothetical protein
VSPVSRDELLGRARRAVLAVAGTAGALGGRVRRGDDAPGPSNTGEARPRPEPTPGLPPRIGPEPTPGLPPRIERDPAAAAQPPRIERDAEPELPPRIRREPKPGLPPRVARAPDPETPRAEDDEITATQSDAVYLPRHVRPDVEEPPPPPPPQPEDEEELEPEDDDDLPLDDEDEASFEPAPVRAAVGPAAPRPAPQGARRSPSTSSTVRDAVRPHARFLTIILVVLIAIGVGYFTLRVHHRISESSLEGKISQRDHPQDVRCRALQSNGSAWACAIIFRAESECVIARVSVFGSWSTVARTHRCAKITELVALLPQKTTATGVAADVGQQLGITGLTCRKVPQHEVRWACGLPPAPGGQCLVLREVRWQMWPAQDGGRLCDHFPELETAIRAAQGEA